MQHTITQYSIHLHHIRGIHTDTKPVHSFNVLSVWKWGTKASKDEICQLKCFFIGTNLAKWLALANASYIQQQCYLSYP